MHAASAPKAREQPEKEAQAHAQHDAGNDRKIKCGVFAFTNDVSGQAPEAKRQLPAKIQKRSGQQNERTQH